MASFLQWAKRYPERKRLVWITGSSSILIERVLELEIQSRGAVVEWIDLSTDPISSLNDSLDKISVLYNKRVICVRSANKIKDWDRIISWIRCPANFFVPLIMVSCEDRPTTTEARFRPFVEGGKYIECKAPTDLVPFIKSWGVEPEACELFLDRVGEDLFYLVNELDKLSVLAGGKAINLKMVDKFVFQRGSDFVEALMNVDKRKALQSEVTEPFRVLGLLEYRLRQLYLLLPYKNKRTPFLELSKMTRVPIFLLKPFLGYVKNLDAAILERRFLLLSKADSLLRRGNRVGVLEMLVSAWS